METLILYADPLIALSILLGLSWGYFSGKLSKRLYQLFWIGVWLGLSWELPLFLIGPEFSSVPPYRLLAPFPIHPQLQWICHSFWDGGLFMLGLYIIRISYGGSDFQEFKWKELVTMISWGVSSAVFLEMLGSMGIWEYIPSWWNPEMFKFRGKSITALAPITWFVASCIFYLITLGLHSSKNRNS
ncbi:MAG: hypothetical protein MRZ79_24470 [Bacteroidia bacterium]|nr:hypothetical protein [Bacteroidia bacterium]